MKQDYLFNVKIEHDYNIDDYNHVLSRYKDWKSTYREIKLNYILEGDKKLQFDIEDIHKYITLDDDQSEYVTLQKICCDINTITFILKNNKVEKLTLKGKILDTTQGKLLSSIIDTGYEIIVEQFMYGDILNFNIKGFV